MMEKMTVADAHKAMWEWLSGVTGMAVTESLGLAGAKKMWLTAQGFPAKAVDAFLEQYDGCFLCLMYRPSSRTTCRADELEGIRRCPGTEAGDEVRFCLRCPLQTCSDRVYSAYMMADPRNGLQWEYAQLPLDCGEADYAAEYIRNVELPEHDALIWSADMVLANLARKWAQ